MSLEGQRMLFAGGVSFHIQIISTAQWQKKISRSLGTGAETEGQLSHKALTF